MSFLRYIEVREYTFKSYSTKKKKKKEKSNFIIEHYQRKKESVIKIALEIRNINVKLIDTINRSKNIEKRKFPNEMPE